MRCILFLTLISFLTWCGTSEAITGARIKVVSPHVDLGTIHQGEIVDNIFRFQNIGNEEMFLGQIKTSCGCTVALPSKLKLLPGEEAELKVTFNSERFTGKVMKEIYLPSNDKVNPVAKLSLTVIVTPSVLISPEVVNFGAIEQGTSKSLSIIITNNEDHNLSILSISPPFPSLTVTPYEPVIRSKESLRIEITMKSPYPGEKMNGYLFVNTDKKIQPQISIPVYGFGGLR